MYENDMGDKRGSLDHINSPLDPFVDYPEQDNGEPTDGRPSILITFQNSASYYTSYMGGQGGRGQQGGGRRNNNIDAMESPVQQNHHPIVVMNDYPNPGPVLVAVNSRKHSVDRGYNPFHSNMGSVAPTSYNPFHSSAVSGGPPCPPGPPGPPGPTGPPVPNLPPSRRSSISFNSSTLELPKKRRVSMTPGIASSTRGRNSPSDRLLNSNSRLPPPTSLPGSRPNSRVGSVFETSTLPRGPKLRPPRSSQSMPTLNEIGDYDDNIIDSLEVPFPSPRPSVCSSAMTETQGERRPLVPDNQSQREEDDWTPHRKPNWLSLNLDEGREKPRERSRSVYVAEIWPSLVCILTAVLVTLTIYLLISYLYTQPIPTHTKNRILPASPRNPAYPGYEVPGHPPYYPYNPKHYEHYPPPYPEKLPPPPDP